MKKALVTILFSLALIPFLRAAAAHVVLISGEYEYFSSNSLPAFKQLLETNYHFRCTCLQRTTGDDIPGIEALDGADLAIFFIRRMTLPEETFWQEFAASLFVLSPAHDYLESVNQNSPSGGEQAF